MRSLASELELQKTFARHVCRSKTQKYDSSDPNKVNYWLAFSHRCSDALFFYTMYICRPHVWHECLRDTSLDPRPRCHTLKTDKFRFIARAAMLARSARPSVRLSHGCFVTKPNNALWIFWHHTKDQLSILTPTMVWNLRSKSPLRKTPT